MSWTDQSIIQGQPLQLGATKVMSERVQKVKIEETQTDLSNTYHANIAGRRCVFSEDDRETRSRYLGIRRSRNTNVSEQVESYSVSSNWLQEFCQLLLIRNGPSESLKVHQIKQLRDS